MPSSINCLMNSAASLVFPILDRPSNKYKPDVLSISSVISSRSIQLMLICSSLIFLRRNSSGVVGMSNPSFSTTILDRLRSFIFSAISGLKKIDILDMMRAKTGIKILDIVLISLSFS